MDEAYASPSSDGHATLPSPTDSTFDLSLLPPPRKRRNRTAEPHVPTSSFINHAPTSHDSSSSDGDDEGDGDETFLRGTLPWGDGYQRMLPSSPEELHRNGNGNESSNGNGNGNGDGGEQKGAEPRRLLLREREAFGARTGNGRRASPPPRLALGQSTAARGAGAQKPQEDEKAVAGETSHAGAVVDESIVRPPATTAGSTTTKDVTSTAIVPAGTSRHQQTNETEPQSPPPPPPNANRRSLVSQGPGIEPQYPIAGNVYGRRKGPGNASSAPPGGDAPLGATSQGPASAGGANRGNEGNKVSGSRSGTPLGTAPGGNMGAAAPEQKPQSAKEDGNGNGNGNDNGNGRNKAPEQRPQPTTSDANNARNKAPEPRAAGDRPSTPPAESTAPALPSTTPAGEPPTAPPIPLPAPIPQPPARPLNPHTPANKPPRKHPALALAPAPIPIPHPLLLRRRSTSPQKRRPNPDAEQEPELPPPQQPRSQPASPDSFLGKTPRYLNWLNSSMDEGHGGSPPGHRQRLREALAQRAAPDESGFVGGDEDSSDDEEDVDGDGDGETGGGGEGQRSFSDGDEGGDGGLEERGLAAVSEEGGGGDGDGGDAGSVDGYYDGANDNRRPRGKKDRGRGGGGGGGYKDKEAQNTVYHSLGGESTADETDSQLLPPPQPQPQPPHPTSSQSPSLSLVIAPTKPGASAAAMPQEKPRKKTSPPMAFDPTMPQFFSDPPAELPSPEPPVKKVKPRPPPLTTTLTTTTTTTNNNNISNIIPARPSIAEIHKVPPPRSTTLIGKKSFNDLLLTSPTSPTSATSATSPSSPAAAETDNPPDFSSLGSGFSFESIPARYKSGHEFTPLGAKVMGSSVASEETVGKGGAGGGEDRKRSKSDPVEIKAWMESKGLVVPMRVGETKEEKDRRSFSEEEEEQPGRSVLGEGYSEGESESEGARGNRHWAALQDFHQSSSSTTATAKAPAVQDDADPRAHTPASINESKDLISELEGSSKTLWVRMAQAEAENNHFRKLLESNNIKIDDSFHDLSSSNLDVRPPAPDDSFDASTSEDVGSLRRRVMELEALLEIVARKEMDLRAENERKDNLVMHWRNQYNDVQKLALQNRQRALGLESQVKALEQRAAAEIANHGREINKVVSKLTERSDVIKNTRQKSLGLEDRLAATEGQLRDARDALDERERTITQLRQALERRCAFSGGEGSAESLQEKLIEQQQAHDADTAKFNNLLEEKDGLVRHLQAELDEMVNLMPVDHGSSRMIDEEEVEDWLDEKSREISQYYDDGLDQIITELHGTGEREDFEEAVEEAEMSLRKVAEQAGLDEPLDKATLAAFGIRQLRTEHTLVKRLLAESEAKVKDTAELQRRGDLSEKLRVSEEQRIALQAAANEAEAAGKALTDQLDALREKLATTDQHIRTLEAETEALELKLGDSDEKAAALEDEKEALRVLVNDTKRLNDMLRGQSAEADQRRHAAADETAALRRQLAEEKAHVTAVETEAIALRHQLARWEDDAAAAAAARDAAQAQLRAVERERDTLRRQLDDAARAVVAARDADSVKRVVKELQERLKALHETHAGCSAAAAELEARARAGEGAAQRLAAEKDFLKAELAEAVEETKAARGRFAMLLHEAAEKGARRGSSREEERGEEDPAACRRALHVIAMELERCALPAHIDVVGCGGGDGQIAVAAGVQDPELVREIVGALRERGRVICELDERGRRYKGAAKKHLRDAERRRARVDELAAEVRELNVRLKAERRGYDEKMGQMILALRKGE